MRYKVAMQNHEILSGECQYHGCIFNSRGICHNYTREHKDRLREAFKESYDDITGRFERDIFICKNNSFENGECMMCGTLLIDVDTCPNCGT